MLRVSLQVLHGVIEKPFIPDCVLCEAVGPELYMISPLFLNCLRYGVEWKYIVRLIGHAQRFPFNWWQAVQIVQICQSAELQGGDGPPFPRTEKY